MDRGITERRVTWRSPKGRETALRFRRMASFAQPSLFLIDCEVTPLNYEGTMEVESTHLALVKNYANPTTPGWRERANATLFLRGVCWRRTPAT